MANLKKICFEIAQKQIYNHMKKRAEERIMRKTCGIGEDNFLFAVDIIWAILHFVD